MCKCIEKARWRDGLHAVAIIGTSTDQHFSFRYGSLAWTLFIIESSHMKNRLQINSLNEQYAVGNSNEIIQT